MTNLRIGSRVTVTNPSARHAKLARQTGTVTYFVIGDTVLLVALDSGEQVPFRPAELSGPHTDAVIGETADRVLARCR